MTTEPTLADRAAAFLRRFKLDKLKEEPALVLGVVGALATTKDRTIHALVLGGVAWYLYEAPPDLPEAVDDAAAVRAAALKAAKAAAAAGGTKEDVIAAYSSTYQSQGIAKAAAPAPAYEKPQLMASAFDGSDDSAPLAKG